MDMCNLINFYSKLLYSLFNITGAVCKILSWLFRLRLLPGQLHDLHLVHLIHVLQVEAQFLCFLRFLTVHLSKADRQERTKSWQI